MTELSPLGTVCKLQKHHEDLSDDEQWDVKARQGYAIAGIEMRLVDEEGTAVAWDGEAMGEVQVRGPWVSSSYFKQDPGPDHFADDGWFRTGDVATISPDHFADDGWSLA